MSLSSPQSTNHILMVEPTNFWSNPQTVIDNTFQECASEKSKFEIRAHAIDEFSAFVKTLRSEGVNVEIFKDPPDELTPEAVFPNNWFSTHGDTVVFYPMKAENRRSERRPEIVSWLKARYPNHLDLSPHENEGKYLESTGSLVLDRTNQVAYASLSSRTNLELVTKWTKNFGYRAVVFESTNREARPVYHTNVMMAVGSGYALCDFDSIADFAQRAKVKKTLESTNHEVIEITFEQVKKFSGNVLELSTPNGLVCIMSGSAFRGLTDTQLKRIANYAKPVSCNLDFIERYSGGSARCMIAELF